MSSVSYFSSRPFFYLDVEQLRVCKEHKKTYATFSAKRELRDKVEELHKEYEVKPDILKFRTTVQVIHKKKKDVYRLYMIYTHVNNAVNCSYFKLMNAKTILIP